MENTLSKIVIGDIVGGTASRARRIQDWLKTNPTRPDGKYTSVPDAKKALNLPDADVKIRKGNLTNNRDGLILSERGKSNLTGKVRQARLKKSTLPQSPEQIAERKAIYKGAKERNKTITNKEERRVIDHRDSSERTGKQLEDIEKLVREGGLTREEADRTREELMVGKGDDPENLQDISAKENSDKEIAERKLQRKLKEMEDKNPSIIPDDKRYRQRLAIQQAFQAGQTIYKYGKPIVSKGRQLLSIGGSLLTGGLLGGRTY